MANVLETGLPSEASTPEWLSPTVEKLSALLALPPNWDSYGACSIDPQIALSALKLLGRVMRIDSPPPSVVPTSTGGIQFEWHAHGIDLEVAIVSAHDFTVSYEDVSESWEKELSTDLSPLANVIARFSAFN
ncbi:MAG TPA: hypothetical protein VJ783_03620, partial [Pirellulales bacterium]|nr:hypothetical protein [Pirellulales bacterium]